MRASTKLICLSTCLFVFAVNVVWLQLDDLPPVWDEAYALKLGLKFYEALAHLSSDNLRSLVDISHHYPPLYYIMMAPFFCFFGKDVNAGILVNMALMPLIVFATAAIGRELYDEGTGALASFLTVTYPIMVWHLRVTISDYALVAAVVLSIYLLIKTRGFREPKYSLVLGLSLGLGMLMKWLFVLFLIGPCLLEASRGLLKARHEFRPVLRNILTCVLVGSALSFYWYHRHLGYLIGGLQYHTQTVGGELGDAKSFTLAGILYYVNSLLSFQLFLPLFILFLIGAFWFCKRWNSNNLILATWILVPFLIFNLFENKQPRFTMQYLPAVALISSHWIGSIKHRFKKQVLISGLILLAIFQVLLASFGIKHIPEKVTIYEFDTYTYKERILDELDGKMSEIIVGVKDECNLYSQNYFFVGKPRREDWRIADMLRFVDSEARRYGKIMVLGVVPDAARFNAQTFSYYALVNNCKVSVERLRDFNNRGGMGGFAGYDYIVTKDGMQGAEFTTRQNAKINAHVKSNPGSFKLALEYPLPDGSRARLYRVN